MHVIRFLKPAVGIEEYVRFYAQREARLQSTPVVHPVPARATSALEFIFGDRYEIHWCDRPVVEMAPSPVIVGLQTYRRVQLLVKGTLESFVIFFRPAGLHRLFSISMHELTNHDYEGRTVLGSSISNLEQRLGTCRSFSERARITDEFLLRRRLAPPSSDGVSAAANEILLSGGQISITALADQTGLSMRQFERRFIQQVGMRPKLYARIARFEAALESKARSSTKSWTDVAHEFGYYDHMHMVHDFKQFSGETPTSTLTQVEMAYRSQIEAVRSGRISTTAPDTPRLVL